MLLLILLFTSATLNAAGTVKHYLYSESADYAAYISDKTYPQLQLSSSYGELISESKIITYQPAQLYNYYLAKVCNGLYLFDCSHNKRNIQDYNHIDLNSESGLMDFPLQRVDGYRVSYTTPDLQHQAHVVSGAILLPQSPEPLKGIVIFYHFSVLDKANVPSSFKRDALEQSELMASVIASNGYLVVMPDYLGLGMDSNQVHPYVLYPEVNALSGIYLLKALGLQSESMLNSGLKEQLKLTRFESQELKLYLSGYSEGAAYALWAAKILQENPSFLKSARLQKTVALDGAYNLSHVTVPFLVANVTQAYQEPYSIEDKRIAAFVKPGLLANVLNSYMHYSSTAPSAVFSPNFGVQVKGQPDTIAALLQSPLAELAKYRILYTAALNSGYSVANNSINSLVNPDLINESGFRAQLQVADIYNWRATSAITFLSLAHDSVVPSLNAKVAYIAMTAKGSTAVKLVEVPNSDYQVPGYLPLSDFNVDHISGLSYLLLFMRNEFNESQ